MDFSVLLRGFVEIDTRISLCCDMVLTKLMPYSLSCYMDLSKYYKNLLKLLKLLRGFVKVVKSEFDYLKKVRAKNRTFGWWLLFQKLNNFRQSIL